MSAPEFADWWQITQAISRYAQYADERRYADMADLFLPDGQMLLFRPRADEPAETPRGREQLITAFESLRQFVQTRHMLAPSRIEVDGDVARAQTPCMAHHLRETAEGRVRFTLVDRYQDVLVRGDRGWLFRERRKYTDWTETVALRR